MEHIPIAHQRIDPMVARAKTPQLHLLPVLDLLSVAVAPFYGHVRIRVRVHQDVKSAVPVELGKEGHRGGDLPEYRLDLGLDLLFGFFGRWLIFGFAGSGDV